MAEKKFDTTTMSGEELKKLGLEGARKPPGSNPGPGSTLHQQGGQGLNKAGRYPFIMWEVAAVVGLATFSYYRSLGVQEIPGKKGQALESNHPATAKAPSERSMNWKDLVTRLQQSMVEAEEERMNREKFVLATVKSLVADMVKTKHVRSKSNTVDLSLLEATKAIDRNDQRELTDSEAIQMNSAEDELELMLSDEKAIALESF